MRVQIVLDHTGSTRHEFDPALATAEVRFRELSITGCRAVARGSNEDAGKIVSEFGQKTDRCCSFLSSQQGE